MAISRCLLRFPLGLVLNIIPQQGQFVPSHFTNISQVEHRLWPESYLPLEGESFLAM